MKASKLPQLHLKPGELILCREPSMIVTVLGSCVSVTMFHPRSHLAGICHAMLPDGRPGAAGDQEACPYRYVSEVVPRMCDHFRQAGLRPEEIEVKLFGGGNVISMSEVPSRERWIGNANVRRARELLKQAGFTIHASNVGGTDGRKILFNTATGEVMHKHLGHRNPTRLP
ncbi:MAG: chemotaxis protein CheD [Verrucomicrobiales bacterium]|nr:chemotaxis protein CheD [Verrucomicrobiales bacterium]